MPAPTGFFASTLRLGVITWEVLATGSAVLPTACAVAMGTAVVFAGVYIWNQTRERQRERAHAVPHGNFANGVWGEPETRNNYPKSKARKERYATEKEAKAERHAKINILLTERDREVESYTADSARSGKGHRERLRERMVGVDISISERQTERQRKSRVLAESEPASEADGQTDRESEGGTDREAARTQAEREGKGQTNREAEGWTERDAEGGTGRETARAPAERQREGQVERQWGRKVYKRRLEMSYRRRKPAQTGQGYNQVTDTRLWQTGKIKAM